MPDSLRYRLDNSHSRAEKLAQTAGDKSIALLSESASNTSRKMYGHSNSVIYVPRLALTKRATQAIFGTLNNGSGARPSL